MINTTPENLLGDIAMILEVQHPSAAVWLRAHWAQCLAVVKEEMGYVDPPRWRPEDDAPAVEVALRRVRRQFPAADLQMVDWHWSVSADEFKSIPGFVRKGDRLVAPLYDRDTFIGVTPGSPYYDTGVGSHLARGVTHLPDKIPAEPGMERRGYVYAVGPAKSEGTLDYGFRSRFGMDEYFTSKSNQLGYTWKDWRWEPERLTIGPRKVVR